MALNSDEYVLHLEGLTRGGASIKARPFTPKLLHREHNADNTIPQNPTSDTQQ